MAVCNRRPLCRHLSDAVSRETTRSGSWPPENVVPAAVSRAGEDWADGLGVRPDLFRVRSRRAGLACFTTPHANMPETCLGDHAVTSRTICTSSSERHARFQGREGANLVRGNHDGTTAAHITYTYTSLSDKGNAFIARITEDHFKHEMIAWEEAMNYYLETGTTLKTHAPH